MQTKCMYKRERGSMAVYVTVVLLSMLILLSGIYLTSTSVRRNQLITAMKVKQTYEADNKNAGKIYYSLVGGQEPEEPEPTYIQEGLYLNYDGINNTGNGHSDSTTTWKDLSGNNKNITSLQGNIGENYVEFTGTQVNNIPISGTFDSMTIEVTVSNLVQTATVLFSLSGTQERLMYAHLPYSDGNIYFDSAQVSSSDYQRLNKAIDFDRTSKHTITFRKSTTSGMAIFVDGQLWAENTNLKRSVGTITRAILCRDQAATCYWSGRMYSFRIYDRDLSNAEILANYQIDKERFGM